MKAAQIFEQAVALHSQGRLPDAERLYQSVLERERDHFGAVHHLGILRAQQGKFADAVTLIGKALLRNPNHAAALNNLGNALKALGRHDEAVASYQRALTQRPRDHELHNNLGTALQALERSDEAIASYDRAVALKPGFAEAHFNRGNAYRATQRYEPAMAAYRQALALKPGYAEALNNHGTVLRALKRHEEALAWYGKALALKPDFAEAALNNGLALQALGRHQDALAWLDRAIGLGIDSVEIHDTRGRSLRALERDAEALASFEAGLAVDPANVGLLIEHGYTLQRLGRDADSLLSYDKAIALDAEAADAHFNRGNALMVAREFDAAHRSFERTLELKPDHPEAHNNIGNTLVLLHRHDDALAHFQTALSLRPDYPLCRSNMLLAMNYTVEDKDALLAAHRAWGENHGAAAAARNPASLPAGLAGEDDPGRRLRIGYISPDFRRHSVPNFVRPLLAAHDRRQVEVFCYADVARTDDVTGKLRAAAEQWRDVYRMAPAAIFDRIRNDRIDVLIELAGHTGGNHLPLFARKPAPVQISWLGYPNTTGLPAIDYRITDIVADPPGEEAYHSERLIRLPRCFLCYDGNEDAVVAPLPAAGADHVTFGSFNNLPKLTPLVIALWARVLHATPGSRLVLKAMSLALPPTRARVLELFAGAGIDAGRITIVPWQSSPEEHVVLYGMIDIALDPFPYNGTTTTCEALWMGVPVVTMLGNRHAGRVGASLLSAVGMEDLIAPDSDSYVAAAAALAGDKGRLAALRAGLRPRMRESPLCDAAGFASAMEQAYRLAWRSRDAGVAAESASPNWSDAPS